VTGAVKQATEVGALAGEMEKLNRKTMENKQNCQIK
jgi:hypothetical protein